MNQHNRISKITIAGGGSAGWLAAAALATYLGKGASVRLVESEEIGIVGVGEASVPHIRLFNGQMLGIDEAEFMKRTQGTIKLGIEFKDWSRIGDSYIHGFGTIGRSVGPLPFHQFWLKLFQSGRAAPLEILAANRDGAARQVRARRSPCSPGLAAGRHRLCLPFRRQPVCALPARAGRAARSAAHRRQDRWRQAARRRRLYRIGDAGKRPGSRWRIVHRLFRLPRAADRADAENRLCGLVALAAMRPRHGRALRRRGADRTVHAFHRPHGRLAVAHPAAAPHRQWLCIFEPAYQR